jgi:CheY-like chemotaxis protein
MVAESILIVQQIYRPNFDPLRSSTRDSSGISSRTGQNSHFSNDKLLGKQSRKSIAIVDDEKDLCSLFSIVVKSLGYHAACVAHDGDEIVKLVLEDSIYPDLILMDYRMPTMNGIQAAEKILQVRPEIKIIIATADDSVRQDAISLGLFFIQKPFSKLVLGKTIEDALGH